MSPASPRHLALVGPSASGKSALALELARQVPGIELISVDSMQVYRGMDIGTAKPSAAERDEVVHHLVDVVDPSRRFTVAQFKETALAALAAIEQRGHTAVLVGGSGLHLQAILGDLDPPGEWPDLRAELETAAAMGPQAAEALYERLAAADPRAASRMQPTNTRRVIRALEVTLGSGQPFSSFGPGVSAYPPLARFDVVGLWLPRDVVAARIEARAHAMWEAGLVDEVLALAARPAGLGPTARQALGYKEVLAHLEQGLPSESTLEEIVRRTRALANRQRRWFRRDPRIHWYGTERNPVAVFPGVLRELERCRRSP